MQDQICNNDVMSKRQPSQRAASNSRQVLQQSTEEQLMQKVLHHINTTTGTLREVTDCLA